MTGAPCREELEAIAAALEASGEYRVVRRLVEQDPLPSPPVGARQGLAIGVETTGADLRGDEVIKLAMVRFAHTPEVEVLGVVDSFQGYHEPTRAISAEISALTGISAETVAGHALDPEAVGAFVAPAVIVLAHNAAFDRRFAERLHPYFSTKLHHQPIALAGGGLRRAQARLSRGRERFLLRQAPDAARLPRHAPPARPSPPASGRTALAHLLERARRPIFRLWAEGAPFEHKDTLKGRGYRWSGGEDGRPRAWWIDSPEDALDGEVALLREHMCGYGVEPLQRRVSACERSLPSVNSPGPVSRKFLPRRLAEGRPKTRNPGQIVLEAAVYGQSSFYGLTQKEGAIRLITAICEDRSRGQGCWHPS